MINLRLKCQLKDRCMCKLQMMNTNYLWRRDVWKNKEIFDRVIRNTTCNTLTQFSICEPVTNLSTFCQFHGVPLRPFERLYTPPDSSGCYFCTPEKHFSAVSTIFGALANFKNIWMLESQIFENCKPQSNILLQTEIQWRSGRTFLL